MANAIPVSQPAVTPGEESNGQSPVNVNESSAALKAANAAAEAAQAVAAIADQFAKREKLAEPLVSVPIPLSAAPEVRDMIKTESLKDVADAAVAGKVKQVSVITDGRAIRIDY